MKLSDYVIDFIARQGVTHIFEFIGGAIVHLLDSTYDRTDIQCISVHHEQTAAFAAEAYARTNGNLGVAMATSGPGALNMLTGIGSCYFDSVPCLFITGQVNTYEYKFDRPVRQIGFQETDIVSVATPLVKYAELVVDADKIRYHLEKAIFLAKHGRPGPVLLDIPMNIQRAQINPEKLESFFDSPEYLQLNRPASCEDAAVETVAELLKQAKRPLILAGGGVRASGATEELRLLIEQTGIPLVASLMGLDTISHDDPAFFGMIGSYGNRYSNLAVANCDFLLILGSRLDSRQTGTRPDTFARAAKKVHVDIDINELGAKVPADVLVHCDIKGLLTALNKRLNNESRLDIGQWYDIINKYRDSYPTYCEETTEGSIDPNRFMEMLARYSSEGSTVCVDVGQHQMWAGQSFKLKANQRMLNSGGMGAMGFALPAAIGAVLSNPGKDAIVIAGDGGIQVNIQELDIVAQHRLPVKIFVMNNGCLGMVRQFQDLYFDGRRQSTVKGYSCPDLGKIAAAYGITSYAIESLEDAEHLLYEILSIDGPVLVDVRLTLATNVNPKLVVNRPIEDMSPHLEREELERIMLIDLAEEQDIPK